MYLSARQVRALGEVTAILASGASPQEVRQRLAEPVVRLFKAQFFVSCVCDSDTSRFSTVAALNMDPAHIRAWDEHFQFVDPVTPRMKAFGRASPVNAVIPQQELIRSEFFNDFLSLDGLYWGINMYALYRGRSVGDMRIWRTKEANSFSRDDATLLQMLSPAFCEAVGHEVKSGVSEPIGGGPQDHRARLKRRFRLSDREAEVAMLVARGASDKEVARQLGIGFATVRYHFQHICEKMGVAGRARLANVVGELGSGPGG